VKGTKELRQRRRYQLLCLSFPSMMTLVEPNGLYGELLETS